MGRVIIVLCLILPSLASAGAWPRGKGNIYFDLSFYTYPQDHDTRGITPHVYLEYGITDKLTFALDGVFMNEHNMFTGIASVTTPIMLKNNRIKLAYGFGYGQAPYQFKIKDEEYDLIDGYRILVSKSITTHTKRQTVTQFSFHMGLGLDEGWLSADAYMRLFDTHPDPLVKLDVTYGRHISPKLKGHVQFQYGVQGDESYFNLAPTLDWAFSPKVSVNVGATYDLTSGYHGIKLGSVFKF